MTVVIPAQEGNQQTGEQRTIIVAIPATINPELYSAPHALDSRLRGNDERVRE